MNNFMAILLTLYIAFVATGCADNSRSPYNSPDQQRAHAEKGQGELSSDLKK